MIVRVMGEGQYEVADDVLERLNELDRRAVDALNDRDEAGLDSVLDEMGALVRAEGSRLPDETLVASEVVIPPSDLTLEETRKLLADEGFIPDPPA